MDKGHAIASASIQYFFHEITTASLDHTEALIALESFVVIALIHIATHDVRISQKQSYASELLDTMTESVAKRINDFYGSQTK